MSDVSQASNSLSAVQLQRIDTACDRFERALRAGEHLTIDAALEGFAEPERTVLARELAVLQQAYGNPAKVPLGETRAPGAADRRTTPEVSLQLPPTPQRFGDYELLDKLGQGGMGEVFRARQISADRIVVLKIIRRDRLLDLPPERRTQWLERFRVEALAAARMEHDGIVPVYQVGEVEGEPYYSMRFIRGHSLGALVQDGPLAPERAARYIEKVARAVHHAHGRGILHRDLKPRNIIIDEDERPYVTDFGLAKWLLGDAVELTAHGTLVGSPPYMAPEQIVDASAVTVAADIYSLGATLYHLLTGRPPFQASTVHETLQQVQHDEPVPPTQLQPRLSRDLETVCLKCLRKNPRRRYATALDLADDLHRFLIHVPVRARPPSVLARPLRWVNRHRVMAGVAAALTVAMIALAVTNWPQPSGDAIAPPVVHVAPRTTEPAAPDPKAASIESARTGARMMHELGMKAWQNGQLSQADNAFETAGTMVEELMRNGAATPAERLQMARADIQRGDLRVARRDTRAAQHFYDHAVVMLDALHREFPAAPAYQLDLALARCGLGMLAEPPEDQPADPGSPAEAAHQYRRARAFLDGLPAQLATDLQWQRRLTQAQYRLGRGLAGLGQWLPAEHYLRTAIAGQQALVDVPSRTADDDDQLACSRNALARLLLGEAQNAATMSDLARHAVTKYPWIVAGLLQMHAAMLPTARREAEAAAKMHGKLLDDNHEHPLYRTHLHDDYATIAEVTLHQRDYRAAAAVTNRLVEVVLEPKARALECAYAAQILTHCAYLAKRDRKKAVNEREKEAESYARTAVAWLREAIAGGWSDWRNFERMPDFHILQHRRDYDALRSKTSSN